MQKIITFLGAGNYNETTYEYMGEKTKTRYIQEALVKIERDAEVIVLLTEKSMISNWEGKSEVFKFSKEKIGEADNLRNILDKRNANYKDIRIFDGSNNEEIWKNFNIIFDELDPRDEIYIDITHSFRSIPIMIMAVINYAKFVKNIEIKGIYYGAFAAKKDGVAPIIDLSLFNTLTDWTIATENFLRAGDSKKLVELIHTAIEPILSKTKGKDKEAKNMSDLKKELNKFSKQLYTLRGKKINKTSYKLKCILESITKTNIQSLIPFYEILDQIYMKVKPYRKNDLVWNIFYTSKLCRDFNMIQQSATFLVENIINYISLKANTELYSIKERRDIANIITGANKSYEYKSKRNYDEKYKGIYEKVIVYITDDLVKLYNSLSNLRNDLNHAGFREDATKCDKIINALNKYIEDFERIIIVPMEKKEDIKI